MNKIIVTTIVTFILFLSANIAMASEAQSVAAAQLTLDSHDNNTSTTPRQPQTLIPVPLPNALPPTYSNAGWKIWDDVFYSQNPITLQMSEALRNKWKTIDIRNWTALNKKYADAPIEILTDFPARSLFSPKMGKNQWKIMGTATVKGDIVDEKGIEGAIFEALYHIKKETNAIRVLVLIKDRLETVGKVAALGTVVGTNVVSNSKPDGTVTGVAGGTGFGKSRSYIEARELVKVIIFN